MQTDNKLRAAIGPMPFAVVFLVGFTAQVLAQDEGGLSAQLEITQNIENIEERGFTSIDSPGARALTALDFELRSITRTQRLDFGFGAGIAAPFEDGSDVEVESIRSTLGYTRSSRNAELSFGALYRRDDVDDLVFDETLADDDIVTGVGEREVLTINSGLIVGRSGRVTGTVNHTWETSEFFDTLDPSLIDTETQVVDARIGFQLTGTMTAEVFGNWTDSDERGAGATDSVTTEVGVGASYRIDPITTLATEIAFVQEESRGATTVDADGLNYALSATRERANGEVSVSYTQEDLLTDSGTRRQVIAGQEMGLPRGSLAYSLGISATDGFDPQPLASLSFSYDLDRNGTGSIMLSQEGTINGDDEEVINSRLSVEYVRALSPNSGISTSFDMVDENVLVSGAADQRTYRFDVSYGYELTRDWALTSGYAYSVVQLDGAADRSRSTVFVGLQRSFNFRP